MTSYERGHDHGYDQGYDDGRRTERIDRDTEWSTALSRLAAIMNAWDIAQGHGEPNSPDEVRAWAEAIAADLATKLGPPGYPSELPGFLRLTYDRHARRDRLMGEFWDACRDGLPTLDIENRLAELDVSMEWVENTRRAARGAA